MWQLNGVWLSAFFSCTASAIVTIILALTVPSTHKKLIDKCAFYGVPHYRLTADTERLGRAVGKSGAVASVGLTDPNLYKALAPHLSGAEAMVTPETNNE